MPGIVAVARGIDEPRQRHVEVIGAEIKGGTETRGGADLLTGRHARAGCHSWRKQDVVVVVVERLGHLDIDLGIAPCLGHQHEGDHAASRGVDGPLAAVIVLLIAVEGIDKRDVDVIGRQHVARGTELAERGGGDHPRGVDGRDREDTRPGNGQAVGVVVIGIIGPRAAPAATGGEGEQQGSGEEAGAVDHRPRIGNFRARRGGRTDSRDQAAWGIGAGPATDLPRPLSACPSP